MFISTKIDLRKLRKTLDAVQRKQVPFALAVALTQTANSARDRIKRELPQHFTLRNKWTERGIRSERATKRDLRSFVYSANEYTVKHETGGIKRPRGRFIALPRGVRKTPGQRITKAKRPAAMVQRKRVYVSDIGKKGAKGIFKRMGRGAASITELQYVLHPGSVTIKPRWNFEKTVEQTMRKEFHKRFEKALSNALRTAR